MTTANITGRDAAARAGEVIEALREGTSDAELLVNALLLRGEAQEALFSLAREVRDNAFPNRTAETRSVIEVSNVCKQACLYCGMSSATSTAKPYLITQQDFLHMVDFLHEKERRVFLIQAGENRARGFVDHIADCLRAATSRYPDLEIILCLGNLSRDQYLQLQEAGARRYVIKFETSNPLLYETIKPSDTLAERVACIEILEDLGYKVGTGNMCGLPGQKIEDIANDILFLGRFRLAMTSTTVFIPGEDCAYHNQPMGDVDVALNATALMRILYPQALMPTTSSLEKARKEGQFLGLMAGANTVTIHDGTPDTLKPLFPIYSSLRFTPTAAHISSLVQRANLTLSKDPLL